MTATATPPTVPAALEVHDVHKCTAPTASSAAST